MFNKLLKKDTENRGAARVLSINNYGKMFIKQIQNTYIYRAIFIFKNTNKPRKLTGREMTFPTVHGSNLLRQKLTLPQDFQGRMNLVFIPFERWQQVEVDSWGILAEGLEKTHEGLVYYELPTLQSGGAFYKLFCLTKACEPVSPTQTRERTITLYLDKADFRAAFETPGRRTHLYPAGGPPRERVLPLPWSV